MVKPTYAAIRAARDSDGIVTIDDEVVRATWEGHVPLEADTLVREQRFIIRPSSGHERNLTLVRDKNL